MSSPGSGGALAHGLAGLMALCDPAARIPRDPVSLPSRYRHTRDIEVAGLLAALLAFGKVDSFLPILHALGREADEAGGPAAWISSGAEVGGQGWQEFRHRWVLGEHIRVLLLALADILKHDVSLETLFRDALPADAVSVKPALQALVEALRERALAIYNREVAPAASFSDLPLGLRHLLPAPARGSACKRWNLFLRWMVRPPTEGVDLGIWSTVSPSLLVIPLDTHVLRISRAIGLTRRATASWRTAEEITRALAEVDPEDPVRFDFALAHLGISGACVTRGSHLDCDACPLRLVCQSMRNQAGG